MISVFDTSIASYNSGNQIIMDSVLKEIDNLFPQDSIIRIPTEDISTNARRYNSNSLMTFVGGTNILNTNIRQYRQWDLTLHNLLILKRCVLMGCGWFQYEERKITKYTKWAYNRILSQEYIHSVRDSYTKEKQESIGIKSINTGCPTLWRLDENLKEINNHTKTENCILTFTDYNQNPQRDLEIFNILKHKYSIIYFFPQGTGDTSYLEKLGIANNVKIINPRLYEFNRILSCGTDYIGTRLHAGIRAMQLGQRSFIVGIDNRALEMARDFKLPVLTQDDISQLSDWITGNYNIRLNLPTTNIEEWRLQFKK